MKKKSKNRKQSVNETPIRCSFLMDGPIKTQVDGTKKGKRGYSRKDKSWKRDY